MKKWLLLSFYPLFLFGASQVSFWDAYTSALRGNLEAQYQSAVMLENGVGVDKNESSAIKLYEKAAISGHKDAQFNLGLMYASGRGTEQNTQFAMMWLASAAAQGDDEARKYLNEIIESERKQITLVKATSIKRFESTAVRFEIAENGVICPHPSKDSHCISVDKNQRTFTSNHKENGWYKITGIAAAKGWMPYTKEGWVRESSVEIQR